jgi:hypothetical protein
MCNTGATDGRGDRFGTGQDVGGLDATSPTNDGQPRLAAATRTGQRHHPSMRDQVGHLRTFTLAADKRRYPTGSPLYISMGLPDTTSTPSHAPVHSREGGKAGNAERPSGTGDGSSAPRAG